MRGRSCSMRCARSSMAPEATARCEASPSSRIQPLEVPACPIPQVAEPVVEAVGATLPAFDLVRHQEIPAPVARARDIGIGVPLPRLLQPAFERCAILKWLAL